MENIYTRTEMILGSENIKILKKSTIGIFGVGGVGSFVAEALIRAGIGNLVLLDFDDISASNINRQVHSNLNTIGKSKVEIMRLRLEEINNEVKIKTYQTKYDRDNSEDFFDINYDYIVDAMDMVTAKLALIEGSKKRNIPIISAMGAGNKIEPTMLEVSDIHKTSVCPLSRVIRKELRNRGIKKLKVVYSKENPIKVEKIKNSPDSNKVVPGSISFLPSTMGLIISSEVIKDILKIDNK